MIAVKGVSLDGCGCFNIESQIAVSETLKEVASAMLRINRHEKTLKQLDQPGMLEAGFKERYDIQQMIRNSPDAFFAEMEEKLLLIGEEVRPTDFVDDRIDLLAIDQVGAIVVLELKRGSNKLQLLQTLTYAAMVSKWHREEITKQRVKLTGKTDEEVGEDIDQLSKGILQDVISCV